ncbi:MAG: hypothetical protein WCD80_15145 [Desulfobaccales bacterium]
MTSEALAPMVAEAMARWGSLIPGSATLMALDKVEFKIADLPGANLSAGYRDLQFYPAQWDGAVKSGNNGDDWIVDFHPRKLHG